MVDKLVSLFREEKRIVQYDDETRYHCTDGHRVRSKAEQAICNWLFEKRIAHGYEYPIPDAKRCDFFIPLANGKGVYVEYWGRNDRDYLKNRVHKEGVYRRNGLELISIEIVDSHHIDNVLKQKLLPYL